MDSELQMENTNLDNNNNNSSSNNSSSTIETNEKMATNSTKETSSKKESSSIKNDLLNNPTKADDGKKIEWSVENELILVEWCDNAQCYKWMNNQANLRYSYMNAWFTIPTITLSTIAGTASFAQNGLSADVQQYWPSIIGAVNIFVGILTTIHQYLKISQLNEAHRVSSIAWDKFARNIRVELAKSPKERMDAKQFIKLCRLEYDRLMETSPAIPVPIIKKFNNKFSGKSGTIQRERFDKLIKPDICNIIITANEYRHHWYKDLENQQLEDENNNELEMNNIKELFEKEQKLREEFFSEKETKQKEMREEIEKEYFEKEQNLIEKILREQMIKEKLLREELIKEKEDYIIEKEKEYTIKELNNNLKQIAKKKMKNNFQKTALGIVNSIKSQNNRIDSYVQSFVDLYGRKPIKEELIHNFKNSEINEDILNKYLSNYTIELINN